MTAFDAARIRHFYDRNTRAFVSYGQGGEVGAIHRAVWGPGVSDRREAFQYVEEQIAQVLERLPQPVEGAHVVDLGCGVGASLCYLAARLPIRGTGITVSPAQAAFAGLRVERAGLADRVTCLEGDYLDLPRDLARADLAFAIESFVHAPDPARFFAQCAALIRPGGALVVCDDVRRLGGGPAAEAAVDRFRCGWHVNALLTADELRETAEAAGFVHQSSHDLTPYLELRRPRDRVIAALVASVSRLPWRWTRLDPLIGGTALQTCLVNGWIGYELMVFRRR